MTQSTESPDTLRFLIADDVTETRRSTRLMLSLIPGAEVVAIAKDGREAVELARQHKPDFALMDVNMPHMNGLQAIRVMIDENPMLACIIISAERDTQTLLEAMSAGARGYLTKPFTADQLAATIDRIWKRKRAQATAVAGQPPTPPPTQTGFLRQQRDYFVIELANEYIRTRRTDEKAMQVLEILAQDPQCEPRFLTALAMIYALNHQWGKLKVLAARLEQ
ncbi:MAG: response regulator transcription factor [Ardenticatenaceae bacterium]|nr:response regulator transcription factor [Anaerolineales bacterium]MCB8923184.1 response regulator transcription factor [Ardenticatenaceae bacterium]